MKILLLAASLTLSSFSSFAHTIVNQQEKLPYAQLSISAIFDFSNKQVADNNAELLKCNLNTAMSIVALSDKLEINKDGKYLLHFTDKSFKEEIDSEEKTREVFIQTEDDQATIKNIVIVESYKELSDTLAKPGYRVVTKKTTCL